MAIFGHVTLSGVDDSALIILIEGKKNCPGFAFNPTTMQTHDETKRIGNRPVQVTLYKDVTLTWNDDKGLKAVETLLGKLRIYELGRNDAALNSL